MGKLIATLRHLPKRTSAVVAVIAAAIVIPATLFAWGPSRATFTEAHPAPYVTFNSITDNSFYGDERNFVTVKDASNTSDGGWTDNVTVQPGKEYVVRMYVHNNAASNLNLVATNVRASASVPTTTGKSVPISGFVSADNAKPGKVWDDVQLNSDQNFNLAYVSGSAEYHNNSVGKGPDGAKLSDSIVTSNGAPLGYDKLDGKIPGCYKYSGYVYFKVKPQFAPTTTYTMSKQVRKAGDTAWQKSVTTKPGDTVEYEISYKNTGTARQDNVTVKDTLPAGINYVKDSTYLKNGTNPNGLKVSDNVVTSTGINIGDYNAAAAGYVKFSAKVADNDSLPVCGNNKLTNKANVIVGGSSKEDTADVTTPKECQPPVTPSYTCDALTVAKIDRTHFKFSTAYTVKNATFKNVTYVIRDANGTEIARTSDENYTQETAASYSVQAIVTVTIDGQDKTATSENCKKQFTVTPPNMVQVCNPETGEIITMPESDKDKYKPIGDEACQPKKVQVCNPETGEIITVDEKDQDKYKPVGDQACQPKTPEQVEVCNPETGKVITVNKEDADKYKPVGDEACQEIPITPPTTPETPTELPHTGASDGIIALLGAGSLIAAIGYYIASRRGLN
jgi:uncharacterized repeat protein (TIGR01451 family)/LPXTG-motif cell wall-anchored protein